jgi:hypothetical protein
MLSFEGKSPYNASMNDEIPQKILTPEAKRALKEAEDRRKAFETSEKELLGRGGLDPVRFGDWEKKGLAVDF